jgi:Xaa-Pro aminopeptidase
MILSNEPGYYRTGQYGIRIENLILVTQPADIPGGDRPMMGFSTLTLAPIDRRLIDPALLTREEIDWIDSYHREVFARLSPALDGDTLEWLERAAAPLPD